MSFYHQYRNAKSAPRLNRVGWLLTCLALFVTGCGGDAGYDVTGTVKYGDGAILSQGTIVFSNSSKTFRGVVMPDGTYKVLNVAAGDYKVAIAGTTLTTEGDFDEMEWDQQKGEYVNAGKKAPPPVDLLAPKFSDPEASGLSATVPDGPYDLTVEAP